MLLLECPDTTTARQVGEVLASARLKFKYTPGATPFSGGQRTHLRVLLDESRVYVDDLPEAALMADYQLSTLVAQLLPRRIVATLNIAEI